MVYYRKYRPQKISELDSDSVRQKLLSILSSSAPTFLQVPHAFLFTGPKGLGKTSTARIIAKVINCTGRKDKSGKDIEPCDKCDQCVTIINGTNLDVFEIDAASNRGIDEIRDLKEKIRLTPVNAKKKVYIIDEVHMLTTEAFNALLKTLEEPPSHAIFILCTTELHKVPATILSRCLHINFKNATINELVRAFKRIVVGEGLQIDDKVLDKIAYLSDGGFRDGTKILEELVSLSGGEKVTLDIFENKYQINNVQLKVRDMLTALAKKDLKEGINIIAFIREEGIDIGFFLSELILSVHKVLLQKVGEKGSIELDLDMGLGDIKLLLGALAKAGSEMKYAVMPALPLELAVIEWCQGNEREQVESRGEKTEVTYDQRGDVTVSSLRRQVGNIAKERAVNGGGIEKAKEARVRTDPAEVSILKYRAMGDQTQEWMDVLWKNILREIKTYNHMIAGVLRSCRLVSYNRKIIVIEAAAKFHKEKLEEPKTFSALTEVCTKLVGNPVQIKVELK